MDKRETETLCASIKQFNVKVVLVIDYEKLEKEIQTYLKVNQITDVHVVKVPKSSGIYLPPRAGSDELQQKIYSSYQDYFRGRNYELLKKTGEWRDKL